jgi:hypothetical protein
VKQDLIYFDEIVTTDTEVVECDNDLVQQVCMWRNFSQWARSIDESSQTVATLTNKVNWWRGECGSVKEANSIASYSFVTQVILDGLMERIKCKGSKVTIKAGVGGRSNDSL